MIYQPENHQLAHWSYDQGTIASEFPLDAKPDRWNFLHRNRIISSLVLDTLVIAAW